MTESAGIGTGNPSDELARARLLNQMFSEEIAVASYDLPDDVRDLFLSLRQTIGDHPELLDRLRPTDDKPRNWYAAFVDLVFVDVQEGLAATMFHLGEIRSIESRLAVGFSEAAQRISVEQPTTIGGGNTRRLNFAYQAHVFAARRTLEYFAGSVAAFFKQENPGFRKLESSMRHARPEELRNSAVSALHAHDAFREQVLSEGDNRSVRDRIAHWNAVPAGVLNVIIHGDGDCSVFLAGGGESLGAFELTSATALADTLGNVVTEMVDMMFSTYAALQLVHRSGADGAPSVPE